MTGIWKLGLAKIYHYCVNLFWLSHCGFVFLVHQNSKNFTMWFLLDGNIQSHCSLRLIFVLQSMLSMDHKLFSIHDRHSGMISEILPSIQLFVYSVDSILAELNLVAYCTMHIVYDDFLGAVKLYFEWGDSSSCFNLCAYYIGNYVKVCISVMDILVFFPRKECSHRFCLYLYK